MKKLFILFLLIFSLSLAPETVHALSFSQAPTIEAYREERGDSKLAYVIGAIARLHFGATAKDWDELEMQGSKLLQNLSPQAIAEFIFVNTYEYKFTMTFYQLLAESLESEFAVQEKEYFDLSGAYIPLNARNILVRGGVFIDVANLFNASAILTTTRPLEKGYEYSNNQLLINEIEMQVNNPSLALTQKILAFEVVTGENRHSGRYIPFVGAIQSIYNYQYTATGMAQDYSFFRVDADFSDSLSELRLLTQMNITIKIGDMTRDIHGVGRISPDLEIGRTVTIDPNEPIVEEPEDSDSDEEDDSGDSWWSGLFKWLLDKLLTPLFAFFDWLKDFLLNLLLKPLLDFFDWIKHFLIPDFSGVTDKLNELFDLFKNKFGFIFQLVDQLSGLFQSGKSLHDLKITAYGETITVFPREAFGTAFQTIRSIAGAGMVLFTIIRCYKRVVGEEDVIQ